MGDRTYGPQKRDAPVASRIEAAFFARTSEREDWLTFWYLKTVAGESLRR
jgi:hypothetical protein